MADEDRDYVPDPPFKLVHQGGHHNVYCDGKEHIKTTGGFTRMGPARYKYRTGCNCATWERDMWANSRIYTKRIRPDGSTYHEEV